LKKYQTYDQVEKTKAKASRFAADVLQDDDLADSLEDESQGRVTPNAKGS